MNVETAIRSELIDLRLDQKVVADILKRVKKKHPQFKDVWGDQRREHTQATLDSVWYVVRRETLDWVEQHAPNHFSRSFLEAA